jgi:hypothetical protein
MDGKKGDLGTKDPSLFNLRQLLPVPAVRQFGLVPSALAEILAVCRYPNSDFGLRFRESS